MEDVILNVFGQPLTRFGLCCAAALLAGLLVCGACMRKKGGSYGTWIRFSICFSSLRLQALTPQQ